MARHTSSKEAQDRANAKYKAKTYKRVTLLLRLEEDELIIKSIEKAHKAGKSSREWLRELYFYK